MPAFRPGELHTRFCEAFNIADMDALQEQTCVAAGTLEARSKRMPQYRAGAEPIEGTASRLTSQGLSTEVVRKQADGTWLFAIDSP